MLLTFLLLVTWVPAMLLLFIQVLLKGSFEFVRNNAFLLPAITVAAFLQSLLATFTMLALSSLSKSSRYVGDPLRRHHVLHRRRLRRHVRDHRRARRCPGCRSPPT